MKTIRYAIVAALLSCMTFDVFAIQNCWFETPRYVYVDLKPTETAPPIPFLVEFGYVCYGSYGGIQPAALFALGGGHSSMTAWLNSQLSVPSGYTIFNAPSYTAAISGWTQCQPHSKPGGPITYWEELLKEEHQYQTTEHYVEMGGQYCCEDTTIEAWDDLRKPTRSSPATESARRERIPREPSAPELSTSELLRLAEAHQKYLNNRATLEQREIFMDRMRAAMSGHFDPRARALAMEASLRAAVSELEERAIPLGNHVRRAPRPTQPGIP